MPDVNTSLRRGAWGNAGSSNLSPRTYVHVRPDARGAYRPMQATRERGRSTRVATPRARCPRSQPMFTSAMHAAPPHNAAMNIRLFLGGLRSPNPSRGRGAWGNPVSPHPSPRAYVHVRSSRMRPIASGEVGWTLVIAPVCPSPSADSMATSNLSSRYRMVTD